MPTNNSNSDGRIDNGEATERVTCPVCDEQSTDLDECEFCGYVFSNGGSGLADSYAGP